ncbi:hypothetical protein PWEIH_06406 [Listeria weihenstephanensis FSL R9-0317]|uniref:Uncharacterized protein n=1 Tax=Listeria weihenstephanensis TaxID=1006155 RepID=A0A1S7FRA5_9LIST|nr:hypothetical protein [Listeria weihenstephanensis]AQY49954.1 hypothetical protein UE46_02095 [Listeria weihenstephanensis]EUJ39697.1 hypothetical protein PWEIH_06406 [Listeria weihenstephanensis FSL R9-0317]
MLNSELASNPFAIYNNNEKGNEAHVGRLNEGAKRFSDNGCHFVRAICTLVAAAPPISVEVP